MFFSFFPLKIDASMVNISVVEGNSKNKVFGLLFSYFFYWYCRVRYLACSICISFIIYAHGAYIFVCAVCFHCCCCFFSTQIFWNNMKFTNNTYCRFFASFPIQHIKIKLSRLTHTTNTYKSFCKRYARFRTISSPKI